MLFCLILLNTSFIFASETIDVKDYIKGKFPVIYNVYLTSLGELDEYEKEFIDILQNMPEEKQKNFAKEVYNNGFSKEILEKIKKESITKPAKFSISIEYNKNLGISDEIINKAIVLDKLTLDLFRMPEVYAMGASPEDISQFIDLSEIIKNKDYDAAKWVLETGLFMEDKSISKTEKKFIDTVQNKPDLLRILITRNVLDGITSSDLKWVKKFNPTNSKPYGYLTDDLNNLPEIKDGIADDEKKAIQQIEAIINDSKTDYQLRKGICLIDEYGVPNQKIFSFNVPNYNTQLQALFHLVKNRNVTKEYYVVALACGLAYGSIITIGDHKVDQEIKKYVLQRFDQIVETDEIIQQYSVDWQVNDYPLEADIGLVWGAPATLYWNSQKGPRFWSDIFRDRQMNIKDFNWLFIENDTLRDMQRWMIKKGFIDLSVEDSSIDKQHITNEFPIEYNDKIDKLMTKLNDYLYFGNNHFTGNPNELIDIEGHKILAGTICNPEWQWRHFIKTGKFLGTCGEDTTAENMLAKSIGISCYHGFILAMKNKHFYTHTIIRYYNPIDCTIKTTPFQIYFYKTTGHEGSPPVSHDGWIYLPWDNFHRFKNIHNFEDRWNLLYHRNDNTQYTIYANGFPPSYIFRNYEID
jgi:hypothetical protein